MIKNIIFDLDGTLINTIDDITKAINETLLEFGHQEVSVNKVIGLLGDGVTSLVTRALAPYSHTKEEIDSFISIYLARQKKYQMESSKPYPGIRVLLKKIKLRGIRNFVCSNKPHENAVLLVEKVFPSFFNGVSGQIKGNKPKPDVTALLKFMEENKIIANETVFVGDSFVDVTTAKNASIYSIAVTWGYNTLEMLKERKPNSIVDKPNSILNIIDSLSENKE